MSSLLQTTIQNIEPKCASHAERAKEHISRLTMPYWALGRLLDLAVDCVAITRSMKPPIARKAVFVMAADHGVTDEGVSLYPREVTAQMVGNFVGGGAAVNVLSRQAGMKTIVVDVGVAHDLSEYAKSGRILDRKVKQGTQNFAKGPAMTRDQAIQAIEVGIRLAHEYNDTTDIFATGEMGIGNTTASAAVASVLIGCPVETIVGRGTGVDDKQFARKINVIEDALQLHKLKPSSTAQSEVDPIHVLSCVGGFEIAALAGLILGAASLKKPILIDGYISTAAALVGHKLCQTASDYMIAAHASAENGHGLMLKHLNKTPLLNLGMRLGEGSGAVLATHMVEAACRVFSEMATFGGAGVSREITP